MAGGGGWGVVLQTFCLWQLWNPAPSLACDHVSTVLVDHEILFVKMGVLEKIQIFRGVGASSQKKGGTGANSRKKKVHPDAAGGMRA
jgi:hypothetical protein